MWTSIIEKQILPFEKMQVTTRDLDDVFHEADEAIRIEVKGGHIARVRRNSSVVLTFRINGFVAIVEDACSVHEIPDIDLVISTVDWPVSSHRPPYTELPTFAFAKMPHHRVLLLPPARYGRDDSFPASAGETWKDRNWGQILPKIPTINSQFPWETKENVVFFAGQACSFRDIRREYGKLSLCSPKVLRTLFTDIIEADRRDEFDDFRELFGPTIPIVQFPRFRYLLHLDGMSTSDRLRFLLAFNSVVIKHESPFEEFWYSLLQPWKEYAPVQANLSDILTVKGKLDNDETLSLAIAEEGMRFIHQNLTYSRVLEYVAELLRAYRGILRL